MSEMGLKVLGIESTAHTFGVSIIDDKFRILSDERSVYKPGENLGIEPHDAAEYHSQVASKILKKSFEAAGISIKEMPKRLSDVYDKEEIFYEFLADKNAIFNFIASNN